MKPLRVKILGSGGAANKHAAAYADLPDLYTVTGGDDHDIVDICTPNHCHYQQAVRAVNDLRSHALVEKPIAPCLAACDALEVIAAEANKKVFPIFQYRYSRQQIVEHGIITRWNRDASYYEGWRGQWDKALGGCFTSHGIHAVDLYLQHYPMPMMVSASMNTSLGVETLADVFLGEPGNMFRIVVIVGDGVNQGGFDFGDPHLGYVKQFRLIHQSITEGNAPPVTLEEARQSIEILTAAYYSAYTGEPVMLPIKPDHPFQNGWWLAFHKRAEQQ